jgi:hypothetical protein
MPIQSTTFVPVPLLAHDDDPHWKIIRITLSGAVTMANLPLGGLVKFAADRLSVIGAVAADDAVLEGVVVDKGGAADVGNPSDTTVSVALMGTFDKNTVKYADGAQPISAAGEARLRDMSIFLASAVPGGAFAP